LRTRARLSLLILAACLVGWPALARQDPAPPAPTLPPFADWLAGVRTEALAKGIAAATLDQALADLAPDPVVIARDRMQPEATQSLDQYVAARLTPQKISAANAVAVDQKALLDKVHEAYGVSPAIMVAVWGAESNYGQFLGTRPVIASLATLAYDSRRASYFRSELMQA
jgi:membrane-bound lytic murein transglycosylase B